MNKKNIFLWLSGIVLVFFLYLISSTNLILKDEEKKVYRVSVILSDNSEEFYNIFKKGIDKAASEFNVDIDIISLYDLTKRQEQKELIEKEIEEGADAIILEPIFFDIEYLEKQKVPFLLIADTIYNEAPIKNYSLMELAYSDISLDLLDKIYEENPSLQEVYILYSGMQNYSNELKYKVLDSSLQEKNIKINLIDMELNEKIFLKDLDSIDIKTGKNIAFLALDKNSINKFLKFIENNTDYDSFTNIYAFSQSMYALNSLVDKKRPKFMFIDEYKLGYSSLKSVVDMLKYKTTYNQKIEYKYIDEEELIKEEIQRIAYPID